MQMNFSVQLKTGLATLHVNVDYTVSGLLRIWKTWKIQEFLSLEKL